MEHLMATGMPMELPSTLLELHGTIIYSTEAAIELIFFSTGTTMELPYIQLDRPMNF